MSVPVPPIKACARIHKNPVDRRIIEDMETYTKEQAIELEGMLRRSLRDALVYIQDRVKAKDREICLWVAERYYGKATSMTKMIGENLKLEMSQLGEWDKITPTDIKVRMAQVMDAVTQGLIPVETGKTLTDILASMLKVSLEEQMHVALYGKP